jgi:hypothetical protein
VRGVGLVGSGPVVRSSGVALEVGAHETVPSNKGLQLTGGRFHCRQRSLRRPQLNPGVGRMLGAIDRSRENGQRQARDSRGRNGRSREVAGLAVGLLG